MRLVKLLDIYMLDLDSIRVVIFNPATATRPAKTEIYLTGGHDKSVFYDDAAITAWHRLSDLCESGGRA